jgi:hypothetical protein
MLRCVLSVLPVCVLGAWSAVVPTQASAWEASAGSPPGWQPHWVQSQERANLFTDAVGDTKFGHAAANAYFRVDAPEQHGRLWVYNPAVDGWAWLPRASTQPVAEPTAEQVIASARPLNPRDYLYQQAPDLAPRLDCIIARESGWDPTQQNPRSRASGLAQFIPSTWATTPPGQLGLSPFEPLANIDGAIWLARTKGWTQWQVYTMGMCR